MYNNALRALAQKDYDQSASVLKQLIETNIPQLEINGSLPKLMSTLQYSCYVNLGNIYVEKEHNCEALECFTKVLFNIYPICLNLSGCNSKPSIFVIVYMMNYFLI